MKLPSYFFGLLVAGTLLASPARLAAHDDVFRPDVPATSAMEPMTPEVYTDESAEQMDPEAFGFASVDLCYMGSLVDPATGETVDLFGYCTEDAISGNFDLA